jgi:hypothetical protein
MTAAASRLSDTRADGLHGICHRPHTAERLPSPHLMIDTPALISSALVRTLAMYHGAEPLEIECRSVLFGSEASHPKLVTGVGRHLSNEMRKMQRDTDS